MTPAPPETRAEARRLYVEGRQSIDAIAARLGIGSRTVNRWVNEDNWPRRSLQPRPAPPPWVAPPPPAAPGAAAIGRGDAGPLDVGSLARRIYHAIDQTLSKMESRMNDDTAGADGAPERDIRALGDALRSVEKLKELEPGTAHSISTAPKSGALLSGRAPTTLEEEDQLRLRIVDRILKLRERRGVPRSDR